MKVATDSSGVGPVERFKADTDVEVGTEIGVGSVDGIERAGENKVRVTVVDADVDVMNARFLSEMAEAGWVVSFIEFEYGYVNFEPAEAL